MDQNIARVAYESNSAETLSLMQLARRLDEYFSGGPQKKEIDLSQLCGRAVHQLKSAQERRGEPL